MRAAAFVRGNATIVPPTDLLLGEGTLVALSCDGALHATVLARMAAGIVKASMGALYICGFDPRLQPVQAKRLAGFVPPFLTASGFPTLDRYIEYRAALWGLPPAQSIVRARHLRARIRDVEDAYAFPLIGALLANPPLLVLDRPQAAHAAGIVAVANSCAILSTHSGAAQADRFRSAALA